jgi:hypothetical protein
MLRAPPDISEPITKAAVRVVHSGANDEVLGGEAAHENAQRHTDNFLCL